MIYRPIKHEFTITHSSSPYICEIETGRDNDTVYIQIPRFNYHHNNEDRTAVFKRIPDGWVMIRHLTCRALMPFEPTIVDFLDMHGLP